MNSLPPKIASRIQKTNGCWVWTGSLTVQGYGRMFIKERGTTDYAHRIVYKLLVGPIPEGLTIDHLCRNKLCVNPEHLETVSARTNILRGYGPAARNARKKRCHKGHILSGKNVMIVRGGTKRQCRKCWSAYYKKWRREKPQLYKALLSRKNAKRAKPVLS
jgi:HNH endonuclease